MRVAFSVAFVTGCSSPAEGDDLLDPTNDPGTSESEISGGKNKKPGSRSQKLAAGCHKEAGAPKSCEQIVDAAFPTEGDYPGVKQDVSTEVQACCVELLTKSMGMMDAHRWDCCANVDRSTASQEVNMACTPWGPPVPPAMRKTKRPTPPVPPAWLEVA
ncbi:MAG: hypothetical protein KF819_05455 [Labilithrix sp.]|nr:hypothetical protein [Labilithrix sp.]